jgi:hypothetical protein
MEEFNLLKHFTKAKIILLPMPIMFLVRILLPIQFACTYARVGGCN